MISLHTSICMNVLYEEKLSMSAAASHWLTQLSRLANPTGYLHFPFFALGDNKYSVTVTDTCHLKRDIAVAIYMAGI